MKQNQISRLDINIAIFNLINKRGERGLTAAEAEAVSKLRSAQNGSSDSSTVTDEELKHYNLIV